MTTRLDTLGGLRIYRDAHELTSLRGRPIQCALLVFMAVERRATRDAVMALLWPEKDRERARGSLNNTVYQLRGDLGDDWIAAHGGDLRIRDDVQTDLALLSSAVEEGRFADALALTNAGFLEGTHLARSPEFEHWVDRQRSLVDQLVQSAHRGVVTELIERGELGTALSAARDWANRVPHDDEAHYWLIRLLAETGHQADALTAYERFRDGLLEAFDVTPDDTVKELVGQIRAGMLSGFDAPLPDAVERPEPAPDLTTDREVQTPAEVWRPPPSGGKKLVKNLGLYLVPAFGLLQILDVLIDNSVLSRELFRPALVLLLLGVPVVALTTLLDSQLVDRATSRGLWQFAARLFSWRNAVLGGVAAAAAFGAAAVALQRPIPSWNRVPSPIAVVPFQRPTSTQGDRALAVAVADEITAELHRWDGVVAVPGTALSGAKAEIGVDAPTLGRTSEAVALGRMVGAEAVLVLTAAIRDDSASVEVSWFNARSGRRVPDAVLSAGSVEEPWEIAVPIVARLLGLQDVPNPRAAFAAGTRSPAAAADYLRGLGALERNRLEEAEQRFMSAIELDSTFASAKVQLAKTIFLADWTPTAMARGPEVARWSTEATEHLEGLSEPNRLRAVAFQALQLGDFDRARGLYDALIAIDSTDVHAHLMRGQVEVSDLWMTRDESGSFVPRSDPNHAWASFSRAVRIRPTFELGYDQLQKVQGAVERPLSGECIGFDQLTDELIAAWQRPTPTQSLRSFCLAALGSLIWVPRAEFDAADKTPYEAGADRLFRESVRAFQQWAAFSPDQPRPLEELSRAFEMQRARADLMAPQRHQGLATQALRYAREAMGLRADTTPELEARLANLHLAAGQRDSAIAIAKRVVDAFGGASSDSLRYAESSLWNVLVASGQASAALAVSNGRPTGRYVRDADTGEFISYAGAEPIVERIRVLCASGVTGPTLWSELDALDEVWGRAGLSEHEQQLLRRTETWRIASGLALDSLALARWSAFVMLDHPLWRALLLADTDVDEARAQLELATSPAAPEGPGESTRAFVLGIIHGKLGQPSEAIRSLSRLDSIPHDVASSDVGWGLQALSHALRARLHEERGDGDAAREHFRLFQEARSWPDQLTDSWLERIDEGLGPTFLRE